MKRITTAIALCAVFALPMGCSKKDKGSTNPDEAAESDKDPLAELQSIPDQIQAEVDNVLQPINDIDVVIEQLTTIPEKHGVNAADLTGLAKASLDGGEVSVDLDIEGDAKAEIEQMLATIKGIGVGIKELPQRSATAAKNIVALGTKGAGLATSLTTKYQAKLSNPMMKADKKAEVQAELDSVMKVQADLKGTVSQAKADVMGLPAKGTEALAKLTAALAGGASAG
jgi:hypothetical protein